MSKRKGYKIVRHRNVHGGFLPAAVLAAHGTLRQIKPITNGIKIAQQLGIAEPINNFLEKTSVGRALKSIGKFAQSALGYGRRRRVGRKKVGRAASRALAQPARKGQGGSKTRIHRRRRR